MQYTGVVKWFSNKKGYGFINSQEVSGDIFAHFSSIEKKGFKGLRAGQTVYFELTEGPKGYHAKNIHIKDKGQNQVLPGQQSLPQNNTFIGNAGLF